MFKKFNLNINEITVATIKEEEYPIKDNRFEYLAGLFDDKKWNIN